MRGMSAVIFLMRLCSRQISTTPGQALRGGNHRRVVVLPVGRVDVSTELSGQRKKRVVGAAAAVIADLARKQMLGLRQRGTLERTAGGRKENRKGAGPGPPGHDEIFLATSATLRAVLGNTEGRAVGKGLLPVPDDHNLGATGVVIVHLP